MRPNSVVRPVATTTPSPRPPTTAVPAYAMAWHSAIAAPSGSGSTEPGSGSDSPVRTLRSKARASAADQPQVCRCDVSDPEEHDVAGDQFASQHVVYLAASPDSGVRGRGLAKRFERLLAAVLGDDARTHDRGQDHEHQQAVADFVQGDRQTAGDEEQDDERLARAVPEEAQQRCLANRFQLVRTEPGGPLRGLFLCETGGRIRPEPLQHGVGGHLRGDAGQVRNRVGRASRGALAGGEIHGNLRFEPGPLLGCHAPGRPPRRRP